MPYDAVLSETVTILGHNQDPIEAYLSRPLDQGPHGGVVLIHHMPGYDRQTKEMARRFATEGYIAIVPNLYHREAPGQSPDDAAAVARNLGGVPDERLVGDVKGAAEYVKGLSNSNQKIGVIGHCSGGRQSFLAACSLELQAAVDCYGAFVTKNPPENSPMKVTGLMHLAPQLSCPLLGLFGKEDSYPAPDEVADLDQELTRLNKVHEFHSYEGAGHAFFAADRPSYRPEAAVDGWEKIFSFYSKYLR